MKKLFKIALVSMLFILISSGCGSIEKNSDDHLTIVTTLYPQYDFARQIIGDKGTVTMLLNPGTEAHDYDPTPADIISITKADIFIYTGEYMETWAADILSGVDNKALKVLDVSKGIDLVKTDEHDDEENEEEGHHHEYDPHIWTSPVNAIKMINNILDTIIDADPDNEEYYKKNAESYIKSITEIDDEIKEVVSKSKYDTIYFGGRFAMIYFVNEYGLKYISAFDSCSSETEPSAKLVTDIVDEMKANDAKIVFYEELTDPKAAESIADEIGGEILLLHSCHNVSSEDFNKGVTYVDIMKKNIENLKIGLGYLE